MSKHYSYGQTCRPQKSESELALKMKILHAICLYFLYKIFLSSRTSSRILTKTLYTLKIRTIDCLNHTLTTHNARDRRYAALITSLARLVKNFYNLVSFV